MTEPADTTPSGASPSPQTGEADADGSNPAGDAVESGDKWDALLKRIAEREKRYTPAKREMARAFGFL
ncbi:MAG TPA: hypothetical protein VFU90_01535 [Candidatus Tumulicola sp.]|nr:hypothetical protein [Candidatus Tumulicola sp.]